MNSMLIMHLSDNRILKADSSNMIYHYENFGAYPDIPDGQVGTLSRILGRSRSFIERNLGLLNKLWSGYENLESYSLDDFIKISNYVLDNWKSGETIILYKDSDLLFAVTSLFSFIIDKNVHGVPSIFKDGTVDMSYFIIAGSDTELYDIVLSQTVHRDDAYFSVLENYVYNIDGNVSFMDFIKEVVKNDGSHVWTPYTLFDRYAWYVTHNGRNSKVKYETADGKGELFSNMCLKFAEYAGTMYGFLNRDSNLSHLVDVFQGLSYFRNDLGLLSESFLSRSSSFSDIFVYFYSLNFAFRRKDYSLFMSYLYSLEIAHKNADSVFVLRRDCKFQTCLFVNGILRPLLLLAEDEDYDADICTTMELNSSYWAEFKYEVNFPGWMLQYKKSLIFNSKIHNEMNRDTFTPAEVLYCLDVEDYIQENTELPDWDEIAYCKKLVLNTDIDTDRLYYYLKEYNSIASVSKQTSKGIDICAVGSEFKALINLFLMFSYYDVTVLRDCNKYTVTIEKDISSDTAQDDKADVLLDKLLSKYKEPFLSVIIYLWYRGFLRLIKGTFTLYDLLNTRAKGKYQTRGIFISDRQIVWHSDFKFLKTVIDIYF